MKFLLSAFKAAPAIYKVASKRIVAISHDMAAGDLGRSVHDYLPDSLSPVKNKATMATNITSTGTATPALSRMR
ncbi:MAG: hypothetical protein O2857_13280, partial [Planctomycetota bacterium]|nr:hypothetical protein [Planctomycetota bacterium]